MYNYQDISGRYITAAYFVALVLTCAILFMNIIVAVLFDNYEDHDEEGKNKELHEIEEKALEIGIPANVCDIIIHNDIIIDAKNTTSKLTAWKKYGYSLINFKNEIKYPQTKYFEFRFVRCMYKLVNHPSFNLFIFVVIGLNTITLSLDIYSQSKGTIRFRFLDTLNICFFAIFTIEVIAKMIGFGCREFVRDKFNIFDAFIVLISLLEIVLASGSGTFTSLRAFRLFRIFKLFRVGDLRILIDCLSRTMRAISPFVI